MVSELDHTHSYAFWQVKSATGHSIANCVLRSKGKPCLRFQPRLRRAWAFGVRRLVAAFTLAAARRGFLGGAKGKR